MRYIARLLDPTDNDLIRFPTRLARQPTPSCNIAINSHMAYLTHVPTRRGQVLIWDGERKEKAEASWRSHAAWLGEPTWQHLSSGCAVRCLMTMKTATRAMRTM